ncbi:ATP-dependent 6-phosphofructokinase 3 [Capsicum chinense]|nr:ATP-dependent 6-phosphofructokinase 3 [Capsicum chinense]
MSRLLFSLDIRHDILENIGCDGENMLPIFAEFLQMVLLMMTSGCKRASILVVKVSELLKSLLTEEKSGIHIIPVFILVDPKIDTIEQVINKSFGFDTTIEEAQRAINAAHVEAQSAENDIGLVKLMGR